MANTFPNYPAEIRASTEHPGLRYVRVPHYFTTYGHPPRGITTVAALSGTEGEIVICRGDAAEMVRTAEVLETAPAYALAPTGPLSAPSGRVFIRFEDSVDVAARMEEITRADYIVVKRVPQAPNAAWLAATSRRVADALEGIGRLERIPNMANVEPQMLSERVHRPGGGRGPAAPPGRRPPAAPPGRRPPAAPPRRRPPAAPPRRRP